MKSQPSAAHLEGVFKTDDKKGKKEKQDKNKPYSHKLTNSLRFFPEGEEREYWTIWRGQKELKLALKPTWVCTVFLLLINYNHQTISLTNSAFHSPFSFLIDIFLVVQQESEKCKVCSFFLVF